jgi:flagellar biosynthesis protein FliQ
MNSDQALAIGQEAIKVVILLAAPGLLLTLVIGVVVGMFQAATQINEATLTFVPKLVALAAMMYFVGPWMIRVVVDYTKTLITNIPGMLG